MTLGVDGFHPQRVWIQHATSQHPMQSFIADTIDDILAITLTAQTDTQTYRSLNTPRNPWTSQVTVLLSHLCTHRHRALLPPRLQPRQLISPSPTPTEHSIHSSSTRPTSPDSGGHISPDPHGSAQHSSSSIIETTSISSSPLSVAEETQSEPEIVSHATFTQMTQALQRHLSQQSVLETSNASYITASVTVSPAHIALEIRERPT